MTIAAALLAERDRQSLTTYRLAQLSEMSPGRLSAILDGTTANPGILTVIAVLGGLGKSLAWLDRQLKA